MEATKTKLVDYRVKNGVAWIDPRCIATDEEVCCAEGDKESDDRRSHDYRHSSLAHHFITSQGFGDRMRGKPVCPSKTIDRVSGPYNQAPAAMLP